MISRVNQFAKKFPPLNKIREPGAIVIEDRRLYDAHIWYTETLPAKLMGYYASLPIVGS